MKQGHTESPPEGTEQPHPLGIRTDHPHIFAAEDGESYTIELKRPLSLEKEPMMKLLDTSTLKDGKVLDKIKMRMPRVTDRLTVSKMPGATGNNVVFEFQLIARVTEMPQEVLERLSVADWNSLQEALGKLTD